jgi:GNAT superfamily N-acetyltransferase
MRADEIDAVVDLAYAALWDYAGEADRPRRRTRVVHLHTTDPGGGFVAEEGGELVGVAMALRREDVWGLSLMAVAEAGRGRGTGRALLDAALTHAEGARGRIILSSEHPAAMRIYASAGHELRPCVSLAGMPARRPAPPTTVRDATPDDDDWMDALARANRGAGYDRDRAHWREIGLPIRCVEDGGWALHWNGRLFCLHAVDEETAVALFEDHLATTTESVQVDFLTAGQDWAIRTGLAAGLALSADGPMFVAGELGPLAPCVPSGSYL